MPARFRLPLALIACAAATTVLSLGAWRLENADVRAEASERATSAAAALEERTSAAVLAAQGVRAAYDASTRQIGHHASDDPQGQSARTDRAAESGVT